MTAKSTMAASCSARKAADVGAIFLGNTDTQFSLTDEENKLNGMVRTTGFFLKESGGAGTVSQVDLMI